MSTENKTPSPTNVSELARKAVEADIQQNKHLRAELTTLRATREQDPYWNGHLESCAGMDTENDRCGCGFLEVLAYRKSSSRPASQVLEQDHGAAIEALRKIESLYWVEHADKSMGKCVDMWKIAHQALATVTNSQQKGEGYHRISDAEFAEHGLGVKAPTFEPEGAATCGCCGKPTIECGCIGKTIREAVAQKVASEPSPTVTEAAKEIMRKHYGVYADAMSEGRHEIESILSRLLGNTEAERRKLREEATQQERQRWQNVHADFERALIERTALRSQLESSQAECESNNDFMAFMAAALGDWPCCHGASAKREAESLKKVLIVAGTELALSGCRLVDFGSSRKAIDLALVEIKEVLGKLSIDAAMQPASAPGKEEMR